MKLRFRTKLFLAFFIVSVLLSGLIMLAVLWETKTLPTTITRYVSMAAVSNSVRGIDVGLVEQATERLRTARRSADENEHGVAFHETRACKQYCSSGAYKQLLDQLKDIDRSPPHFGDEDPTGGPAKYLPGDRGNEKDVYIMARLYPDDPPNIVYVLVDLDYRAIGEKYDMSPYPRMAEGWNRTMSESKITDDKYGYSLGAWSPIRNSGKKTIALLGIDVPAKPIRLLMKDILWLAVGIFVFAIVVSIIPAWFISRKLNRPIKLLDAGMQRVSAGDNAKIDPVLPTGDELEDLTRNFNVMVDGLSERDTLLHSLQLAKEIQQRLLPHEKSPCVENFDIYGDIIYCDETGGDYFDYLGMDGDNGHLTGVAVGDVTGHGIGAALLMASGRAVLRSHAPHCYTNTANLFDDINVHLVHDTGNERFMTMFYGAFDSKTRELTYSSAGHDPVLWYHAKTGEVQWLGNTGIPLGILDDFEFSQAGPLQLESGDVLIISTDGIREAKDATHEEFGPERIESVTRDNVKLSAHEIHDAIVNAVMDFQVLQDDDITLVVVKCT